MVKEKKKELKKKAPAKEKEEEISKEERKRLLKKKKKMKKSKKYGIKTKAKKKMAVARATIKRGKGKILVNKRPIEFIEPRYVNEMVREPIDLAGDLAREVDISVNVKGGGFMSQAMSARAAIAKALVEYSNDEKLRKNYLNYDRMLLVDDPRRVESKKPLGKKARRKKQSSKR
jgi:small subunit ribosomal protein S9